VFGFDVVRDAERLRHVIGLAGQNAAVDENLTGLENLVMVGRLYHLPAAEAKRRAENVLERFELIEAAHRPAKTYSGGMRRRLDLGASLVGQPKVLFLDEPTTGLDPKGRLEMWDIIRELVSDGTTLLLTTQYLDEADNLSDSIAVIDGGRVIAEGTSDELKDRVGGEVLQLRVADRSDMAEATGVVFGLGPGSANTDNDAGEITLPVGNDGPAVLTEAVRRLDTAQIKLADIALRRPSLDDVFLALTGHAAEERADSEQDGEGEKRRGRSRG
jgi:ABC-2 type transport system ATP-binding protein